MQRLHGLYVGYVEATSDPLVLGRLLVRVPTVHGPYGSDSSNAVGIGDLAWALPGGLPNGSSSSSGTFSWLPAVGDQVFVAFIDGEPEKPVWFWGPRTLTSASKYGITVEDGKEYPAQAYSEKGYPVARKYLSAYDHSIIFNKDMLHLRNSAGVALELSSADNYGLLTTSTGYSVAVAGESVVGAVDGSVTVSTEGGITLSLDDSVKSIVINSTTLASTTEDITIDTVDMDISGVGYLDVEFSGDVRLVSTTNLQLVSPLVNIDCNSLEISGNLSVAGTATLTGNVAVVGTLATTGAVSLAGGSDPVARLSDLAFLVAWINTHTHSNGNLGSPTGSPMTPAITPACSAVVSTL